LLRDGLYRVGEGEEVMEEQMEWPIKVGDVEEMGWWENCWPLNHNMNLQHSENLSAV
jgi:hypothetical protein